MKMEAAQQLVGSAVAFLAEDDVRRTSYDRRRNWRDWTANSLKYGLLEKVETQVVSRPDRRRAPFRGSGQPVEREDQRLTVCTIKAPDGELFLIRPMALVGTSADVEQRKREREERKAARVAGARRAEAIKTRLQGVGEVERNGSDEFAILLTLDEAEALADRLDASEGTDPAWGGDLG